MDEGKTVEVRGTVLLVQPGSAPIIEEVDAGGVGVAAPGDVLGANGQGDTINTVVVHPPIGFNAHGLVGPVQLNVLPTGLALQAIDDATSVWLTIEQFQLVVIGVWLDLGLSLRKGL